MELFAAAALGFLAGALLLLAWSGIGFIVAFAHYLARRPVPPTPPAPNCGDCETLQALWVDMQGWEKVLSLANFVAAAIICAAKGCGGLNLRF